MSRTEDLSCKLTEKRITNEDPTILMTMNVTYIRCTYNNKLLFQRILYK